MLCVFRLHYWSKLRFKTATHYVNYALFGTPVEVISGKNLGWLHKIKKKDDPDNADGKSISDSRLIEIVC